MVLKKVNARAGWWVLVVLLTVARLHNPVGASGAREQANSFVFTAHGDHGAFDSPEMLVSLNALAETGAAFSLGLGDLSYEGVGDEQRWCETIQQVLGPTYPFEIVLGNHEDEDKLNGYIGNFVRYCPDHMNAQGILGAEYYFDYPVVNPLVRVIMIGADNSWDWNGDDTLEANENFEYDSFTPAHRAHLTWLVAAIDSARDLGVPWVVVGMHKNCLTVGTKSCEIGPELMNVLVEKKVDLILQGHDHTYQRSKQLAVGSGCASIPVEAFDSDCVVDDGADGVYAKGAGSVLIVAGHFGGRDFYDISLDDPETGYFVKAMGGNGWFDFLQNDGLRPDVTKGFVTFEVSEDRIVVNHVPTTFPTMFSDSFVIGADDPLRVTPAVTPTMNPSPTPTPTPLETLTPSAISPQTDAFTTLTFAPISDAYVNQDKPDANYGGNIALRIDASPEMRSYLRFDTRGVSGTVLRATLKVYANTASSTGYDVRAVSDSGWTESGLTYANAPAVGARITTSGAVTAETWAAVDVTTLVTGGGIFDLALTTTGNTAVSNSSREGTNPPELSIDFHPAPPTATPPPANTLVPTESLRTLVLTPVADAYVHAANPDANYGRSPSLRTDASPEIRSYLRFELAEMSGPIVRATLRLYSHSASNAGYTVHSVVDQAWSEADLTYITAPAVGDAAVSSNGVSAGTWTTVDVTAWVMGNDPLDLALTTIGSRAVKYSSREGVHPPELIIEFNPAPSTPPSTLPSTQPSTQPSTPAVALPSLTPTPLASPSVAPTSNPG